MYVLLVYDVSSEKDPIIHKYLSSKLTWVQNSVFEGELSLRQLKEIKAFCESFVNPDESVRIYVMKSKLVMKKILIGRRTEPTNII